MTEQWIPSNSGEGYDFIEQWCARCARDAEMNSGKPFDQCAPEEVCEILAASFRGEAVQWVCGPGADDEPTCTAFIHKGVRQPCEHTDDLFIGGEK